MTTYCHYLQNSILVLIVVSILFGLLCCFTNIESISLTRQFILMLELYKVLAMPVHRPHAPYVGVPKLERRRVLLWRFLWMKLEIYGYFKSENDFSSCTTIPSALKYFPKSSTASESSYTEIKSWLDHPKYS